MRYSYSRLSAVNQCGLKYAWRYFDSWFPARAGIEAFVGSVVHKVVEADHEKPLNGTEPWDMFSRIWEKDSAGKDLIDVRQRGVEYWKDYGSKCVSNYIQMGRPEYDVLGIEMRFTKPIGSHGDTLLGIADRVLMVDPPNGIRIEDMKTGKKPANKYFLSDHQLPLYAELARLTYGFPESTEIYVERLYLATGTKSGYATDQKRRDAAWTWALQGIEKDRDLRAQFDVDRSVEPDDGPLCGWCDYKPHCPLFTRQTEVDEEDRAATLL